MAMKLRNTENIAVLITSKSNAPRRINLEVIAPEGLPISLLYGKYVPNSGTKKPTEKTTTAVMDTNNLIRSIKSLMCSGINGISTNL
jgi:hypothetical protein